ncbi:four helix bundle protein [Candidatus Roizmanbacteria bacterium RIFCSPHIGHO2_01_FULL_39_8]|uniref:Four helix bundle protein n=2 Tax=Candidatus Roizmaniibacteriota TaxID=1752723 RepID=A0A1F7GS48_9BACT|nr:MAG: four helix bundle protein [Candidatus Roizmanbacteria bacterium RIFCSPHIGHO2_01_FULL_39_8]OGK26668.1 MAG: four helix bundle protein [Candidatus Roizmanbacteria bacterium RIFCSPHIGHO2_02_FULL_39_9]
MKYDLEERVEKYGEAIIEFAQKISLSSVTKPLLEQLVRSGTSIGANYFEANGASSKKDFINKIYICKKESKETQHWLRMVAKSNSSIKSKARYLFSEALQLGMIFSSIITKTKNKI